MKLHLTSADNQNLITAYGSDYIQVNQSRHAQNLIIMPEKLILDWFLGNFDNINHTHFEQLIEHNPEVVLLGTGEKHQFMHPKHYASLAARNIPLECMTTAAACRTYNILMSEGRNVAAALLLTT